MPRTVLHLNTEAGWRGGEAQTLHLAEGLASRGWNSIVVAQPGSELARRASGRGLPVETVASRGEWDLGAAGRIARLIGRVRPDILHYHTAHAVALGTLSTLRSGRRRAVAARRVSFALRGRLAGRLKYSFRIDRIIAVSEGIRRGLIAQGLPADRVVTVHSGIDPARFAHGDRRRFRASLPDAAAWPPEAWWIGTAGHLAAHKGFDLFLEAAALAAADLPEARFVIAGGGEEEASLRRLVSRRGLSGRVVFAGFRDDMPDVLAGLDLFCLTSTSGEGSPAAVKEAMAAGVPLIASALDGVGEIVEDARHGLLTPPGDAPALARAMVTLSRDGALRERLAAEARRRVEAFTIDVMVERTEIVYGSLGDPQ